MIHLCSIKTGKGKWVITSSDCEERYLRTIQDEITAREVSEEMLRDMSNKLEQRLMEITGIENTNGRY